MLTKCSVKCKVQMMLPINKKSRKIGQGNNTKIIMERNEDGNYEAKQKEMEKKGRIGFGKINYSKKWKNFFSTITLDFSMN